jgi:hypothetical protein
MPLDRAPAFLLVLGLTLLSGMFDSQGFVHAARIWQGRQLVWTELGLSALGWAVGIGFYWMALRYMAELRIVSAEAQAVIWFGVTLVGVAITSGQFFKWPMLEQIVALAILAGIGWLMFRTGA